MLLNCAILFLCVIMFLIQISSCDACQRVNQKMVVKKAELHPVPVKSPWFHISIDFIGPISPTSSQGNRFILTLSDYFTKFVQAVPLPDKCSSGVSRALFKVGNPVCTCMCFA